MARTLEIVGERWTLLIVRDLLMGMHRFDDLQRDLGVARNVLHSRLTHLIDQGVVERRPYQLSPTRYEYRLTEAGLDLWPVIVSLLQWGDRHRPRGEGPSVILSHRGCGGAIDTHRCCSRCGERLGPRDVWAHAGEDIRPDHPLLRRAQSG